MIEMIYEPIVQACNSVPEAFGICCCVSTFHIICVQVIDKHTKAVIGDLLPCKSNEKFVVRVGWQEIKPGVALTNSLLSLKLNALVVGADSKTEPPSNASSWQWRIEAVKENDSHSIGTFDMFAQLMAYSSAAGNLKLDEVVSFDNVFSSPVECALKVTIRANPLEVIKLGNTSLSVKPLVESFLDNLRSLPKACQRFAKSDILWLVIIKLDSRRASPHEFSNLRQVRIVWSKLSCIVALQSSRNLITHD